MEYLKYVLIALGLAMDAFAVSVSSGVAIHKMHLRHALRIGFFFGFFQALMPFIGWELGEVANQYISAYDHWVAFGLLSFVGGKMIYEALYVLEEEEQKADPLNLYVLFVLSIATSIDALAVGVTFSIMDMEIFTPIAIIGIITFLMSVAGMYIGDRFGHRFNEKKMEIAGGVILIGIGTKILVEDWLWPLITA